MGIKERLESAQILWDSDKKEDAWALTLIAAAATARKRYPKPAKDNEAFKAFMHDVLETIIFGRNPSKPMPTIKFGGLNGMTVEELLYNELRCYLIHEAEMPTSVEFSPSEIVDGKLQAELRIGPPHQIPDFWVLNLMKAVRDAPENADVFK